MKKGEIFGFLGPNGSGKSNVVDAVAWVLGAQAPSAVRSQRMDDVIFDLKEKPTIKGEYVILVAKEGYDG